MESEYNRIFGCYSPEKWRNNNGKEYEVKNGYTFVFYFPLKCIFWVFFSTKFKRKYKLLKFVLLFYK